VSRRSTVKADPQWSIARAIYEAGVYQHAPEDVLQLRVVREGSSYATIDLGAGARRMFTRPSDLLLSLPGRGTSFILEDKRELTVLRLARDYAARCLEEAAGMGVDELEPLLHRPVRDRLIGQLCRRLEGDETWTVATQHWAIGIILALLATCVGAVGASKASSVLARGQIERVRMAIDAAPAEPHPVEGLARLVGLPRRVFAAAFRAAVGMPVHQYVMRRRVDLAVQLLGFSDVAYAEIAARAGFAHQGHMGRVLKAVLHRTPSELRANPPS